LRFLRFLVPGFALLALAIPATAFGAGGTGLTNAGSKTPSKKKVQSADNGGAGINGPATEPSTLAHPTVVGDTAKIVNGVAYAPSYAPIQVKKAIWAGNQIRKKPYIYGGGHGQWNDAGYDCSGSVSYALHGGGLLSSPEDSTGFESYGEAGPGKYITIYANSGHVFMVVDGKRFDTVAQSEGGSRWSDSMTSTAGYVVRHPAGL
jgi:cell wall-associated NlpC family hydrolase